MIKKIFIVVFLLLQFCFYQNYLNLSKYESKVYYAQLEKEFKWLDITTFHLILNESKRTHLKMNLICSVIQIESNGKNVVSRANKNKTRDLGIMQINSCHVKYNKKILLDKSINIKRGCTYLAMCYKKSNGNLLQTLRKYNQGIYGKEYKYRNWKYTSKILDKYIMASL